MQVKRIIAAALVVCLCLLLGGCEMTDIPDFRTVVGGSRDADLITPSPAPRLTNEPAQLLAGVETDRKAVALIFEGYTDETSVNDLIGLVKAREIPCVWFVSGATAFETGAMVRRAQAAGIELGNYTVSAEKELHKRSAGYLVHQFERTQELILKNAGVVPSLARCNGTEYTYEVLQAVAAGGLKAAVEPTLYINHRSFQTEQDARIYMKSMIRGAVISVKLGQELDANEYGDRGEELDERPAIDPSPSISEDNMMRSAEWKYQNIVPVVTWLLDALAADGYEIVALDELQELAIEGLGDPRQLTEAELALLDASRYDLPVTDKAVGQGSVVAITEADLAGTVFVGDSVTQGLGDYVAWRRESEPEYLAGVHFLTAKNMTVESALSGVYFDLPQEIRKLQARRVCLMLRFENSRACTQEKYLASLRVLISQIRAASPEAQIIVQSMPPGVAGRIGSPDNGQLFAYDLLLAKMCLAYNVPFVDTAFALRDENGDLQMTYCIDPQLYGRHLSDEGCEAWLKYLMENMPAT